MSDLSFSGTVPAAVLRATAQLAAMLAILAGGTAQAQELLQLRTDVSRRDFRYELGLVGGGQFFHGEHSLGRKDSDPPELSPASAGAFGLQFTVKLHPHFSVEAEGLGTRTSTRDFSTNMWIFQLGGQVRFHPLALAGRVEPYLLLGYGAIASLVEDKLVEPDDQDGVGRAGLGLRVAINERIALRLEGRIQSSLAFASALLAIGGETSYGGPDFLGLASVALSIGGPPRLLVANKVVLEEPDISDKDGDGLINRADRCPREPEDADGFQDDDGCPDDDNDQDGIADARDRCPLRAEIKNDVDDQDGCPETDDDKDGILGSHDQCADKPEVRNGFQDTDGCPDDLPPEIKRFAGIIESVKFKIRSEELLPDSYAGLDQLAGVLTQYPDLKIEIAAHTDNRGKEELNVELSRKQAEKVRNYLLSKGIQAERILAVGHGMTRPLESNNTIPGRAANRRIELRFLRN
jgi:OmpA-OmpF porin, OOP family